MTDPATQPGADEMSIAATKIEGLLFPDKPETETAEVQQTEVPAAETEATQEGAEETKAEPTDAETKLETLEELAEATGLPLESLLNIKARTKVDGEEKAIPLSEIVKSYQLEGHVTKKSMELAEQRKAFEAERETRLNEISQRLNEATALSHTLEQNLMSEYNSVDWVTLENTDRAEFVFQKQKYNDRWNQIQGLKQKVAFDAQRITHENQKKQDQQFQEFIKTEKQRLVDAIPEWRDETKAKTEQDEIRGYLKTLGFSNEDIGSIVDHRHVKIIRDAMRYQKASKTSSLQSKKVATLPKMVKPGTQSTKGDGNREKEKDSFGRLQKSGKLDDAAAVILQRMK